jgi:lipopolysaccharide export system permease protein
MNNFMPPKLTAYLGRVYLISLLSLLGILLAIVYLFETVELLRRAAKFDDIPLSLVLKMGLLKMPETGQIILPFAVLFSALYTFWLLARRHELVILRGAGLSVWQFLGPIVGVAMLAGFAHTTIVNPIGALMISRYETLESTYLGAEEKTVSISEQGLWLRQKVDDGHVILHASTVKMPEWVLNGVMVLFFEQDGSFVRRIDSESAVLKNGQWEMRNATINEVGKAPEMLPYQALPTSLTITEIEESFSTPEETPFWTLPSYIHTMEATGFDSRELKIHFQSLLAQPLLFAAMVILAATVSLRTARFQKTSALMGAGIVFGFVMFFATSFLKALGASDQIPVLLAAWFPPLIALSLGISVIMTTEDG